MLRATSKKLAPPPGALGRAQKVKYHSISITKLNSIRFLYQTFLCSFKIRNISNGIFVLTPRLCLRDWNFGRGALREPNFIFSNMVMWHIKRTGIMLNW